MNRQRIQRPAEPLRSIITEDYFRQYTMILPELSSTKLRQVTRIYHGSLLSDLKKAGKLPPQWAPQGKQFNNRMMVNLLRQRVAYYPQSSLIMDGAAFSYNFSALLEKATENYSFLDVYGIINKLFLDAVVAKYPRLREACDEQRSGPPIVAPEDIFRDVLIDNP